MIQLKVKYVRYSAVSQTGSRQLLDTNKYDLVVKEQCSGTIAFAKRPKAGELLKMIHSKNVSDLYVQEFSRLGRDSFDTLSTLNACQQNDVNVHILDMNISSKINGKANPVFKMFSHIISVVAEQQREGLLEITAMGRLSAKMRGVTFGRKPGTNERKSDFLLKEKSKRIIKYLALGNYTIRDVAKLTETSTTTVLKVKRLGEETKILMTTK